MMLACRILGLQWHRFAIFGSNRLRKHLRTRLNALVGGGGTAPMATTLRMMVALIQTRAGRRMNRASYCLILNSRL